LKAIGLNHGFESAIADLVDNSLDAGAKRVLIRFVLHGGLATQLLVLDNGCGMDADEIDSAMQLGKPKPLTTGAMGHFGVGLKSASFSQASELTVLSRKAGNAAVGRRMLRETKTSHFEFEVLDSKQVESALDEKLTDFSNSSGTIVRWDAIRTFPASRDPAVTSSYVETKVADLKSHLGLMFHRLLRPKTFSIEIDVFDSDIGESGFPFPVEPIDPFAYVRTGAPGYPKTLHAECGSTSIPLVCHIWPAGSDSHFFKLAGAPVDRFQGFYLYRNNRLLSAGQWLGAAQETKRRRLARVAVDIEKHLDVFSMSVEKSGVHMVGDLVHAVEHAESADGTTFASYLVDAEEAFRQSNRRVRRRSPVLPPGQGISPKVRQAISREVDFIAGEEPLRIRWKWLDDGDFAEVDRRARTLWLNVYYREAILKGAPGSVNDAPLLKALLFLLYEDVFRGTAFGPKDKDNVSMWLDVLTAAAEEERRDYFG
jgi:anti-sigma regulatory factor (Ser/Thr protein kinase)